MATKLALIAVLLIAVELLFFCLGRAFDPILGPAFDRFIEKRRGSQFNLAFWPGRMLSIGVHEDEDSTIFVRVWSWR